VFVALGISVSYCYLCPVRLHGIFPHYLTNGTIFEKKNEHKTFVLIFSTAFV